MLDATNLCALDHSFVLDLGMVKSTMMRKKWLVDEDTMIQMQKICGVRRSWNIIFPSVNRALTRRSRTSCGEYNLHTELHIQFYQLLCPHLTKSGSATPPEKTEYSPSTLPTHSSVESLKIPTTYGESPIHVHRIPPFQPDVR